MWANNPNAFIAQEDDESQEYSLRVAGLDLLSVWSFTCILRHMLIPTSEFVRQTLYVFNPCPANGKSTTNRGIQFVSSTRFRRMVCTLTLFEAFIFQRFVIVRWRPLEAALAALGAVSPSVLEVLEDEESSHHSKPLDVESLLLNIVPPLLNLSGNYSVARQHSVILLLYKIFHSSKVDVSFLPVNTPKVFRRPLQVNTLVLP